MRPTASCSITGSVRTARGRRKLAGRAPRGRAKEIGITHSILGKASQFPSCRPLVSNWNCGCALLSGLLDLSIQIPCVKAIRSVHLQSLFVKSDLFHLFCFVKCTRVRWALLLGPLTKIKSYLSHLSKQLCYGDFLDRGGYCSPTPTPPSGRSQASSL